MRRRRFPQVLADDEGAYAVRRTVPPSAALEAQIDQLLAVGVGEDPRVTMVSGRRVTMVSGRRVDR
jgi:hypothetical protein